MSFNEKLAFAINPDRHFTRETYTGEELRPTPGIPPERFEAFKLPSRTGDNLHFPETKNYPE